MNEQIAKIAEDCGLYIAYENKAVTGKELEAFAQLIIKECMSINTQRLFLDYEGDTHRVAHNNALWCAWGDMKEHFGVE